MYMILWEYELRAGAAESFALAYGPHGAWVELFERAEGYLGAELYRSAESDRWMTIDRWVSEAAFDAFMARFGDDYAAVDRRFEHLTARETRLGAWRPA
jgi:heme-degrading monooxygenase HmoA